MKTMKVNGENVVIDEKLYEETLQKGKAFNIRYTRDKYLKETDKYFIEDFPIDNNERECVKNYRHYLRDLPQDPDFPNIKLLSLEEFKQKQ